MLKIGVILVLVLFTIGGIGMWFSNKGVDTHVASKRWLKYGVYVAIVTLMLTIGFMGQPAIFILLSVLLLIGLFEIVQNMISSGQHKSWFIRIGILLFYLFMAVMILKTCSVITAHSFIALYLLVAGFDGFSQVIGQLFGRRQLSQKISPNKTVEGFIGGLFISILLAGLLRDSWNLDLGTALILGTLVGLFSVMGDLSASWLKRWLGIKDFSAFLPGHGGILDRFDGFFAVLAAYYLWLMI